MESSLGNYAGREQSFIKHQFLTSYLKEAAFKTLQARSPIFNFIDGFAGPWRVQDTTNYSDASFDQALRTLENVRSRLVEMNYKNLKIRFCLCEKRKEAVAVLRRYAAENEAFEIHVFHGSFEDHLPEISKICHDGFTFTFIDPTGWKIRSEAILEFLKKQKGEFLLNFMAEHVNRHAEFPNVAESFGLFLADPEWEREFNALFGLSNEMRILRLFKRKVRDIGAAQILPDFPILKPNEDRIKMRLVLGTNSEEGLKLFREVQSKVERTEIETRNKLKDGGRGQINLFSDAELSKMQQDEAGVGCLRYRNEAEGLIAKRLSEINQAPYWRISRRVLEEIPIRQTQLNQLVVEMRAKGIVDFELPDRKKVPQRDTVISINRVGA